MGHPAFYSQQLDEGGTFLRADPRPELWIRESPTKLSEQLLRDDKLEISIYPASEQRRGCAGRRQERSNKDVRVEDGPHSLPSWCAGPVLGFDGQAHGVILVHPVLFPEPVQEVETKVTAKRLLDYLAVALPLAGSPNPNPAEHVFVESYRRPDLPHKRIIAY